MNYLPTLYKKNKNGSTQQWTIGFGSEPDGKAFYEVEFGQVDGLKQTKRNYTEGKNLGKANETTALQQSEKEAIARHVKEMDKNYSTSPTCETVNLLPMLAHKYLDHSNKVKYPAFIQRKLNGQRCVARKVNDKVVLTSRTGKVLDNLKHIEDALLPIIGNLILDGELYIHGETFQDTISWIKRFQPQTLSINYYIYDMIDDKSFSTRFAKLSMLPLIGNLKLVETYKVDSFADILSYHSRFLEDKYEGTMIRHSNSPYEAGKRSHSLLKFKDFQTEEFKIFVFEENKGLKGQCSFILETDEGCRFSAKPEGSAQHREQLFTNAESLIGEMATVRFFEWTTSVDRVPRFPIFVNVREEFDL